MTNEERNALHLECSECYVEIDRINTMMHTQSERYRKLKAESDAKREKLKARIQEIEKALCAEGPYVASDSSAEIATP